MTSVRNRYRAWLLIVRDTLGGPMRDVRFWATSDLRADTSTLTTALVTLWDIEVLFADVTDLMGLGHYQVMTTAIALLAASVFLEEERTRLRQELGCHITLVKPSARGSVSTGHISSPGCGSNFTPVRRPRPCFIDWPPSTG